MSAVVVAFDVDGTLTTRDSLVPFLRRFPLRPWRWLGELPTIALAAVRRDRDLLRAAATRAVFTGVAHADVADEGARYAGEIVARRLRDDTTARLAWHVEQGHRVVFVSASYDAYLDGVATALGVEAVLSTRLDVRDGRCTGGLVGNNCRGSEKVVRLHAWLADQGLRRDQVVLWAYGDSNGDRELLAAADHAVWVTGPIDSVAPRS